MRIDNLEDWCGAVFDEVLQNKQKVVLIGGASSSGKSVSSQILAEYFVQQGLNAIAISADNYYKGLSQCINERVLSEPEYSDLLNTENVIVKVVRNIIESHQYSKKFNESNLKLLKEKLEPIIGANRVDGYIFKLCKEYKNLSFDDPQVVDFKSLANDLNSMVIHPEKKVFIPEYSFVSSEKSLSTKVYPTLGTDIFIVEGLYVLREEMLSRVTKIPVLKTAVDCNLKTLLARKFNRDIKFSRNSFTPEENIITFLTEVMPSYHKYILPTLTDAKYLFDTSLTIQEIEKKSISNQCKFFANEDIVEKIEKLGGVRTSVENHKDYFVEETSKYKTNNISLRIREIDGEATKLSIKIDTGKDYKHIEEYNLLSALSKEYRDINVLLKLFSESGFKFLHLLKKTREQFTFGDINFAVDYLPSLGYFVEVDEKCVNEFLEITNKLGLSEHTNKAYIDIFENNILSNIKIENERKYKLNIFDEKDFAGNYESKKIAQHYINFHNYETSSLIKKLFFNKIDLENFVEARVRVCNSHDCALTLKSDGLLSRDEAEIEIPLITANFLIKNSIGSIHKTRYSILKNSNFVVELDKYDNLNLAVVEVEYSEKSITEFQIKDIIENLFDKKYILEDITNNVNFKNKNLAIKLEK